jgi:hypothetical protein
LQEEPLGGVFGFESAPSALGQKRTSHGPIEFVRYAVGAPKQLLGRLFDGCFAACRLDVQ